MSLFGYKKKWGEAGWTSAFPSQRSARPAEPPRGRRRAAQPRASWTAAFPGQARRRAREGGGYPEEARRFVAEARARGETCPVVAAVPELREGRKYGWPVSAKLSEVHHVYGRGHGGRGPLLSDRRLWMAVSKQGHRWVHSHPAEARARGWLAPAGRYNCPVPDSARVSRNEFGGVEVGLDLAPPGGAK